MSTVQINIIIDGQAVDYVAGKLPLALTFSVDQLNNFGSRTGGFSKTFDLPATKANNLIFGGVFDPARVDAAAVTAKGERAAEIRVNGLPVMTGKARLKEILGDVKPTTYKVQIFGDSVDWSTAIRDLDILDLDFGFEIWDDLSVNAAIGAFPAAAEHTYPLVNYGEWSTPSQVAIPQDYRPWLGVLATIEKIFDQLGYSVISDFFKVDPEGERYSWSGGAPMRHTAAFMTLYTSDMSQSIDKNGQFNIPFVGATRQQTIYANFDTLGVNPGGLIFPNLNDTGNPLLDPVSRIVASGGALGTRTEVFIEIDIEIEVVTFAAGFVGNIYLTDAVGTIIDNQPIWDVTGVGFYQYKYEVGPFPIDILSAVTDRIYVVAKAFGQTALQMIRVKAGSRVKVRAIEKIVPFQGFEIIGAACVSGLKQLDFIRGITHAFNLYWKTDTAGQTVSVEPREEYFDTSIPAKALDEVIDLEKGISIKYASDVKRLLNLTYQSDSSDSYVEELEKVSGERLFGIIYDFGDQAKEGEEVNSNPFFAATHHLKDINIKPQSLPGTPNGPIIPRIWGEVWDGTGQYPEPITEYAPRLIYYRGLTGNGGAGYRKRTEQANGTIILGESNAWPMAFSVNYNDPTAGDPSTSFADVEFGGNTIRGLAFNHYLRHLATTKSGAILTAHFLYQLTEISALDFRILRSYRSVLYQLVNVQDFKPLIPGSTKTVLKQIAEPLAEDEDNFTHSSINGFQNIVQ